MPEYLSPGVYVEEVPAGPRPIEGVSTSTAGFAGPTERGSTEPRLVTNWGDFVRWYGDTIAPAESYLPFAVRGFFDNGGQRAFIARVTGNNAVAASLDFPAPGAANDAGNFLRATALGPGTWGNNLLLRIENGTQANPAASPPRDFFRLTLLYYRDGIPAPFIDPTTPASLTNPRRREPDVQEEFDNLSAEEGRSNYVLSVVNAGSRLVRLEWVNTGQNTPAFAARPTNADLGTASSLDLGVGGNPELRVTATGPGTWGNSVQVAVADGTQPSTFQITVVYNGQAETYDDIPDTDPDQALTRVNSLSTLVRLSWINTPVRPDNAGAANLAGGIGANFQSGTNVAVTPADFLGDASDPPDERTGLAALETIDEISLLLAPDEVNGSIANNFQITNALVDQCERLRDRFTILSIARGQGQVQSVNPPRDSTYGAVYYPWIHVVDTRTQEIELLPPSGHVAGIYARTDVDRGVHKAPANEVVRGIVNRDLPDGRKPLEYLIVKGEHDILNPRGVNVIRDFRKDGRGIRVWGARTVSSDPLWRYVNVRRLFLFIEESIDEGTQWVVFEPNHEPTWAKVSRTVTNFLTRVWRSGALQGVTQDEAFFVKCDRSTMSQDDIDNGRLICVIGVAPVKPAEFVIFRISQKTLNQTS